MHTAGSGRDILLNNGLKANFITLGLGKGTLSGFPFIAEFTLKADEEFDVVCLFCIRLQLNTFLPSDVCWKAAEIKESLLGNN